MLLLPLVTGSPAGGSPIDDKKAEAARVAQQLEDEGNRLSISTEQFNRARLQVDALHQAVAKARDDVAHADQRMQAIRGQLGQWAVSAYVNGGSNTLLNHMAHSTNGDMVIRNQYLQVTAAEQRRLMGDLRAARQDLGSLRAKLDGDVRTAELAQVATDRARQSAAADEAAQRALLGRVNGELGTLVAAEAARREAAAADAARRARETLLAQPRSQPSQAAQSPRSQPNLLTGLLAPPPPTARGAAAAVAEAERQVGKPYVYGAAGPDGFDCSGLMMWAWHAGGVSLSHSAYSQYTETTRVPLSDLRPGDILFFGPSVSGIHHDAMYVGNGEMVEAPHTGLNVRYASISRSDLIAAGRPG